MSNVSARPSATLSAEVRSLRDGTTYVATPSGRHFTVAAPVERVWSQLSGHGRGEPVDEDFREVVTVLAAAGVFPRADAAGPDAGGGRTWGAARLALCGDAGLCAAFAGTLPADEPAPPPVVLAAGALADALAAARFDCLVGLYPRYDWRAMLRAEARARASGVGYVFFHFEGAHGFFGPMVRPGEVITYGDLHERRLCAAGGLDGLRLAMEPPQYGEFARAPEELRWHLHTFGLSLRRWLADPTPAPWAEVETDASALATRRHVVQPMPDRLADADPLPSVTPRDLVDARTGIVTKVESVAFATPAATGLRAIQTWVADLGRVYGRDASVVNAGFSHTDDAEAEVISIGESLERYCANVVRPAVLRYGSHASLTAAGCRCVEPSRFALFSPTQHARPDFPYVPLSDDQSVAWVPGVSLTTGEDALLPASLVYLLWHFGDNQAEPPVNPINFAGVSAGPSTAFALANALEEVVERDAMMAWWLSGARLPALPTPPSLRAAIEGARRHGFAGWFLRIDHPTGLPVVAAVLDNAAERITTVGFACRDSFPAAARKAWTEAVGLQETSRDLQRADGALWREKAQRRLRGPGLRDHRPDRRYADDYRSDFADVISLVSQLQINLDPRLRERWLPLLTPAGESEPDVELPRDADCYRERIERAGFEVFQVDLTTPDVAAAGVRVVRALAPGMLANFPTAFPPLGGLPWIVEYARRVGWEAAAVDEATVNPLPLPYA